MTTRSRRGSFRRFPNLQPLLALEPVAELAIDDKTLPPQQGRQPQKAIAAILRRKNLQPIDNCRILFRQRPLRPTATGRPPRSRAAHSNPTRLSESPQLCAWPSALPVASSSFSADLASN